MSLAITGTMVTSDVTDAFAVFRPYAVIDGRCGAWVVSRAPGGCLTATRRSAP